jgi:transcription elongation GreA/GreB family factor
MALTKRHSASDLRGVQVDMSVAFTKEDSAETASETLLPDRPISPHPNLVTEAGLKALEFQLHQARGAYQTAQMIEDVNERRRQAARPLRDVRYFAARVRTAQVITEPMSADTVAFGSTVTFKRDDGRVEKYRIVGEDEADPKSSSISFVSPSRQQATSIRCFSTRPALLRSAIARRPSSNPARRHRTRVGGCRPAGIARRRDPRKSIHRGARQGKVRHTRAGSGRDSP